MFSCLSFYILLPKKSRAVKFTSKLFGRALSRRIKATVLYATETGKSEQYAKQLVELLGHAFNAQVRIHVEVRVFTRSTSTIRKRRVEKKERVCATLPTLPHIYQFKFVSNAKLRTI